MATYALQPSVKLIVNNRDATGDFTPYLLSMSFVDHMNGEADGLEIQLEDVDARWIQGWYPVKGATVQAWLGYESQSLLACGEFQIDEITLDGPPDTVTVRAVGNKIKSAMRTKKSKGYESVSLKVIASQVAAAHGLAVVGTVPDVHWTRVTQSRESDLGFLQRLALEHGMVFTVKGDSLVFHDTTALEAQKSILTIHRYDVSRYSFRDKPVPSSATSGYFDANTKTTIGHTATGTSSTLKDAKKSHRRVESKAHAQRLAKAALHVGKTQEREGTLSMDGNISLVAGANVELQGWGVLDGLWQIKAATHKVDRSGGYTTDLEVRYVSA